MTAEEYLAIDRAALDRHEYCNGEILPMPFSTRRHSGLTVSFGCLLGAALNDGPYFISLCDLRLQIAPEGAYVDPDVMVVREPLADGADDLITNPCLVVEILSPSSERWDRGGKFAQYRRLESLREYLLVSQDEMRVEW